MSTETVKACPHGHISVSRRVGATKGTGSMHGPKRVPIAKTEYYCKTCANKHSGGRADPHYDEQDLIEKERRVNDHLDYDVSLGYVWSPSHEEGYPDV